MPSETQLKIDGQIRNIDKVICRNIDGIGNSTRGAVSQDILAQLRNFVEHIMLKFYADGQDIEDSYDNICSAINFVKIKGELKVLWRFHDYLQIVASHFTLDEENSERLMLKYYEYLLRIKGLLKEKYDIDVLGNIEKFPVKKDPNLQEYYNKIAKKIQSYQLQNVELPNKYYIQKIKPFFVGQNIFYEVTFAPANDCASKFNRAIAFTSIDILKNYSVRLNIVEDSIKIFGKSMPILVIVGWEVAIRNCEYKNFTSLIRGYPARTRYSEQKGVSMFLSHTGLTLLEVVDFPCENFQRVRNWATQHTKDVVFFDDLEVCRQILQKNSPGSNVIRYLLYCMNNKVIKNQYHPSENHLLSGLHLKNGCIPFDKIPFNASLLGHNPKLMDLFGCIETQNRQHELLARLVRNNTEMEGILFTPIKDIKGFADVSHLAMLYNSKLWSGHVENSKLVIENGHIFINGYKNDTSVIIGKLKKMAKNGVQNYSNSVLEWLNTPNNGVDCDEKREALVHMFDKSSVALVYGAAGTGKSTFINHVAHFFSNKRKLFLAQTHPAVDNLKRRVNASNCEFMTIAKFLNKQIPVTKFDLIVIDECSTVNNKDMKNVLEKGKCQLLVLVGDSYQISSIRFGNWFSIAPYFISKNSVLNLTMPYRSNSEKLLVLWNRVRKMDDRILEIITRQGYSSTLDDSIFVANEIDEIILCLNYDGLYGINNINLFLQENNPNTAVHWGIQQYKMGDPILFNDVERFSPIIYNNMKGRIKDVKIIKSENNAERIQFDIELDKAINGMDAFGQDFELLESASNGNSIIRFYVNKDKSVDDDDSGSSMSIVPFQVAYAVSIHKAQGLEYNSVKIVITNEVDELITHNIFYTAITRARNHLKIYWTPEIEKRILGNIEPKKNNKDAHLLRRYL